MYSPEYYQKNKEKMRASQRKWYNKVRQEKIDSGEIVILSPEQKLQRKLEKAKENASKLALKYQTVPEHREKCKAAYRDRYHNDPEFRARRAADLKNWRAKKQSLTLI
jgi:hypothetical protein